VVISYLLTLAFVLVGVSVIFLRTRYAVLVYFLAVAAVVGAVTKFDMASIERRDQSPSDSAGHEGA
jgi:hypothetical protein